MPYYRINNRNNTILAKFLCWCAQTVNDVGSLHVDRLYPPFVTWGPTYCHTHPDFPLKKLNIYFLWNTTILFVYEVNYSILIIRTMQKISSLVQISVGSWGPISINENVIWLTPKTSVNQKTEQQQMRFLTNYYSLFHKLIFIWTPHSC